MNPENHIERMPISVAKKILGCRDIRTVVRFCRKNEILIVNESRTRYISIFQFETALDKPFISFLQDKYGKSWIDMYRAWKTQDIAFIAQINDDYNRRQQPIFPKIPKTGDQYVDEGFLARVIQTAKTKTNENINRNTK